MAGEAAGLKDFEHALREVRATGGRGHRDARRGGGRGLFLRRGRGKLLGNGAVLRDVAGEFGRVLLPVFEFLLAEEVELLAALLHGGSAGQDHAALAHGAPLLWQHVDGLQAQFLVHAFELRQRARLRRLDDVVGVLFPELHALLAAEIDFLAGVFEHEVRIGFLERVHGAVGVEAGGYGGRLGLGGRVGFFLRGGDGNGERGCEGEDQGGEEFHRVVLGRKRAGCVVLSPGRWD